VKHPFAYKKLNEVKGRWEVYFNPKAKLCDYPVYTLIAFYGDQQEAEIIVELLNENKERFE